MKVGLIIDIAILVILVICGWNGFKNGIIRGICGIIAVILALYGASVVSKMYSNEFTSMLKPFVGGMIDRSMAKVLGTYAGEEGEGDTSDPSAIIVQCTMSPLPPCGIWGCPPMPPTSWPTRWQTASAPLAGI